ncbi:histidine kinase [Methylobacterium sp. sgz302541]|uniref:histidine kinase n=1 Tax=unclassified Methylobacterium TaxID=2615210 RepID=UPI003D34A368
MAVTTSQQGTDRAPQGGCYGVQVLIAGRRKRWRDEVVGQIRRAGFSTTACDSGVDALTVLALGLPVDVLVIDVSLSGALCCAKVAVEARALRPGLRIVMASDLSQPNLQELAGEVADIELIAHAARTGAVAHTVREALSSRGIH